MDIVRKYRSKTPGKKALLIIGALFFLIYFGLGVVFVVVKTLPFFEMRPLWQTGFGILLIAYSIFRLIRLWRDLND